MLSRLSDKLKIQRSKKDGKFSKYIILLTRKKLRVPQICDGQKNQDVGFVTVSQEVTDVGLYGNQTIKQWVLLLFFFNQ